MDSLTKGSGIAVSVLVAATASVLLLVPGHPGTTNWQGAGTSRGVVVVSAEPTSPPGMVVPGRRRRVTRGPVRGRRPSGGHLDCQAMAARGGRPRPAVTISGRRGGPAAAGRGSCQLPRVHRHQESPARLPRYHGIRPDLP